MSTQAERVDAALNDEHLRGALRFTTDKLYKNRKNMLNDLDEQAAEGLAIGSFEELRRRAHAIKEHTIDHLDYYLAQAAANIRAAGGVVHWAADQGEVAEIALSICKIHGVKSAIKSKSMASEEVHLNHALEQNGITIVESDLGEYIIQLAHETPAHIVMPSIHKTRRQVADLFEAVAGKPMTTDTASLTAFARKVLRQKFMAAEIGFTGGNFVVAETGTLCINTNEGNGRLTTSVPPVQVAIVGMEKLVPTMSDLAVELALLPRNATGQKITSYFNLITGPRRPGEPDGPEELHVIFLDNGRTNILGTQYEESLDCIRCGACLNVCPVYRNIGGHAYGSTYPGPIGTVITPLLTEDLSDKGELSDLCTLCGACTEACPQGIQLHEMIRELRVERVEQKHTHWFIRFVIHAWMTVWLRPWTYRLAARASYWLMRPFVRRLPDGREVCRNLPFPMNGWTNVRDLPAVQRKPFHQRWAELQRSDA